jgi:K+-transporting ATPase ATPase C chain
VAAAYYQLERVARARGMLARLHQLVDDHIIGETFGLLGEPRVNVLELNLALDAVKQPASLIGGRPAGAAPVPPHARKWKT